MASRKIPVVIIEKPYKGIVPQIINAEVYEGGPYQYSRSDGIDIFRNGFEGHISPAQIFDGTAITSNINSLARATVNDPSQSTASTYMILGGLSGTAPRWVKVTSSSGSVTANGDISAHAAHNFTTLPSGTGFWGEDIALYNVSGAKRVFYSWSDNTDADVGVIDTSTDTATDNFMSTTPTGHAALTANVPHRMVEGADAKLYITNGRYVSSYDGATNTYTATAYDAGVGWITVDVRAWKSFLMVVAIKVGDAYRLTDSNVRSRVMFWNYTESGLGTVYDIDDPITSAAFIAEDVPYIFTQGKDYTGKIRQFDGSRFRVKKYWPIGLYGTIPQPNAIEYVNNNIAWAPGDSNGARLMAYSPAYDGLHAPYQVNNGSVDATTIGTIKNFYQGNFYVGTLIGGAYKLLLGNSSAGYATSKTFKDILHELPYKGNITDIKVYFSQFVSGASCQVAIAKNYDALTVGGTNDQLANTAKATISTAGTTDFHIDNIAITDVSSFHLALKLSGQVSVRKVEVYWFPSQQTPGYYYPAK